MLACGRNIILPTRHGVIFKQIQENDIFIGIIQYFKRQYEAKNPIRKSGKKMSIRSKTCDESFEQNEFEKCSKNFKQRRF
jgi:hypothetical protein